MDGELVAGVSNFGLERLTSCGTGSLSHVPSTVAVLGAEAVKRMQMAGNASKL